MNDDPIAQFLTALPGYNPHYAETDRRKIVGKYDLAELPYLWADAQSKSTSNPIGLFLMMCDAGQHSPAYIADKQDQQHRAEFAAAYQSRVEPPAAAEIQTLNNDDWTKLLGEIRMMWNGNFTRVNPRLVATDESPDTMTILVNFQSPGLKSDLERILHGINPRKQWKVKIVKEWNR